MSDKLINKSAINVNNTTNATGLLSALGAVSAGWDGIMHDRPVGVWLPMVMMGLSGAVAQWLQGEPTPTTKLIANVLQLDGTKTNAELVRAGIRRVIGAGVVPGLDQPAGDDYNVESSGARTRRGDETLGAHTLEAIANDVANCDNRGAVRNPGAWNVAPETIPPNTDQARIAARRAADQVRGRTIDDLPIGPGEFSAWAQSGDFDDNSCSVPVEGVGEWQN